MFTIEPRTPRVPIHIYRWTVGNFTPSIREYQEAKRAVLQLSHVDCGAGPLAGTAGPGPGSGEGGGGCHPGSGAGAVGAWASSRPPAWSAAALAVPDLATRPALWYHGCSAKLLCEKRRRAAPPPGGEAAARAGRVRRAIDDVLKFLHERQQPGAGSSAAAALMGRPSRVTLCISGSPVACAFGLLRDFFDSWPLPSGGGGAGGGNASEAARRAGLGGLGEMRVMNLGDDAVMPTTPARDGVGLPAKWRGPGLVVFGRCPAAARQPPTPTPSLAISISLYCPAPPPFLAPSPKKKNSLYCPSSPRCLLHNGQQLLRQHRDGPGNGPGHGRRRKR